MSTKKNVLALKATLEDELRRYLHGGVVNHTMLEITQGLTDIMGKELAERRFNEICNQVKDDMDRKAILHVPQAPAKKRGRPRKESSSMVVSSTVIEANPIQFTMRFEKVGKHHKFIFEGPANPPGTLAASGKVLSRWSTHSWKDVVATEENGSQSIVGVNANCTQYKPQSVVISSTVK